MPDLDRIREEARRRLSYDLNAVTPSGAPMLRGWKRVDGGIDTKLVGTDPSGQAWVIGQTLTASGKLWSIWNLEHYRQTTGPPPVTLSHRVDAIHYVSDSCARHIRDASVAFQSVRLSRS